MTLVCFVSRIPSALQLTSFGGFATETKQEKQNSPFSFKRSTIGHPSIVHRRRNIDGVVPLNPWKSRHRSSEWASEYLRSLALFRFNLWNSPSRVRLFLLFVKLLLRSVNLFLRLRGISVGQSSQERAAFDAWLSPACLLLNGNFLRSPTLLCFFFSCVLLLTLYLVSSLCIFILHCFVFSRKLFFPLYGLCCCDDEHRGEH